MFTIVLKVLGTAVRQQREIKGIQIGNEEFKLFLFTDNMILYMENPRDSTHKPLYLIQQFINLAGYKVNVKKSVVFLYTNTENTENEIRVSIQFSIAPRTIRYLGINLTKEVKELYSRNYRTFMKIIEEDKKRWQTIPCSSIKK